MFVSLDELDIIGVQVCRILDILLFWKRLRLFRFRLLIFPFRRRLSYNINFYLCIIWLDNHIHKRKWFRSLRTIRYFYLFNLVCMMGLITVILTLLNKITDGAHDKYHMYDTIPSYLLVFFKLLTIIIFIAGCIKTIL